MDGTWYARAGLPGDAAVASWSVSVEPSWIYFVRDHIGLGGYFGYEAGRGDFLSRGSYRDQGASLGVTGAFEVGSSGRWGVLLRPSLGAAARFRKYEHSQSGVLPGADTASSIDALFDPKARIEHLKQRDLRGQLQLRASLVYALS
ncbi:MAG: hypothetical protein JWN04_857 [Myxococcaceae bacterium]|nr:hypothetical protein [Myxococcaceae bacterium]